MKDHSEFCWIRTKGICDCGVTPEVKRDPQRRPMSSEMMMLRHRSGRPPETPFPVGTRIKYNELGISSHVQAAQGLARRHAGVVIAIRGFAYRGADGTVYQRLMVRWDGTKSVIPINARLLQEIPPDE